MNWIDLWSFVDCDFLLAMSLEHGVLRDLGDVGVKYGGQGYGHCLFRCVGVTDEAVGGRAIVKRLWVMLDAGLCALREVQTWHDCKSFYGNDGSVKIRIMRW